MSLTYTTFTTELALLAEFQQTDPSFVSNLPSCIDYATDHVFCGYNGSSYGWVYQ